MNKSWLILLCTAVLILTAVSAQSTDAAGDDNPFQADLEKRLSEASEGSTVILKESGTITSDLVIPRGVTLLLPYDENDTVGTKDGDEKCLKTINIEGAHTAKNVVVTEDIYITLTVDYGVTVKVYGTVIVGGIIGYPTQSSYQGHTSGIHSNITLNGVLALKDGSTLTCYGFIRGNGEVTASAGATVYEPLVIHDSLRAGDTINLYSSNQMPFNRYSLVNIQTETIYYSGSTLYGMTTIFFSDSMNHYSMTIIGEDNGLISLSDGASAILTYDADKYVFNAVDEGLVWNLGDDTGTTTISLRGGATISAPSLTITAKGYTLKIDFEKVEFSIPYSIHLKLDEGDYVLENNIRILPGSIITVDETAILRVEGGITAYWGLRDVLFRYESYPWDSMLSRCGFDTNGRLIVNGYLVLEDGSYFSGIAEHTGSSGGIVVEEGANVGNRTVSYGCIRTEYKYMTFQTTENLSTRIMAGYVFTDDGTAVKMESGKDYAASSTTGNKINSYTQRDEVAKKTTEYKTGQWFYGTWKVDDVVVPEKVVVKDVPFEVNVSGTTVTASDLASAIADIAGHSFSATEAPVLDIKAPSSAGSITLSADAVEAVKYSGLAMNINLSGGSVRIAANTLNEFSGDAVITLTKGTDHMTAQQRNICNGKESVYISLNIGGIDISTVGCFATVSIPCSPSGNIDDIQIWHIVNNGDAYTYDAEYIDGKVVFKTRAFGTAYAVAYSDPEPYSAYTNNQLILVACFALLAVGLVVLNSVYWRWIRPKDLMHNSVILIRLSGWIEDVKYRAKSLITKK